MSFWINETHHYKLGRKNFAIRVKQNKDTPNQLRVFTRVYYDKNMLPEEIWPTECRAVREYEVLQEEIFKRMSQRGAVRVWRYEHDDGD